MCTKIFSVTRFNLNRTKKFCKLKKKLIQLSSAKTKIDYSSRLPLFRAFKFHSFLSKNKIFLHLLKGFRL